MPYRSAALFLLALSLSATVNAEGFQRSGELRWTFDDVTTKQLGVQTRSSSWSQDYAYAVDGPLAHENIGDVNSRVNFSKGSNVNQSVAGGNAQQDILGYAFAANLFRPGLRNRISFSPRFSRDKTDQAWGQPLIPRSIIDQTWGYRAGLALPHLPGITLSRSYNNRYDKTPLPAINQDSVQKSETLAYSKGAMRFKLNHDERTIKDKLALGIQRDTDEIDGDLEFNFPRIKKGRLETLFLRTNYRGRRQQSGSILSTQKTALNNLYLTTKHWKRGDWRTNVGYGNRFQKDMVLNSIFQQNNLSLFSRGTIRRGTLNNSLSLSNSTGESAASSLTDRMGSDLNFRAGRYTLRSDASYGWHKNKARGRTLADLFKNRLTFQPNSSYNLYIEGETSGVEPIGDSTAGSRRFATLLGSKVPVTRYATFSTRLNRTWNRQFSSQTQTVQDQINFETNAAPADRTDIRLSYTISFRKTGGEHAANRNFQFWLGYRPTQRLTLSGQGNFTDSNSGMTFSGTYSVGKTSFIFKMERREFANNALYNHMSVSLSRKL